MVGKIQDFLLVVNVSNGVPSNESDQKVYAGLHNQKFKIGATN